MNKEEADFYKFTQSADGLYSYCKICATAKSGAWYAKHSESVKAKAKQRRAKSPDRHRAASNAWKAKNRERNLEITRQWREENREQVNAARREKYRENPAEGRAKAQARHAARRQAIPSWADSAEIQRRYDWAALFTAEFGETYEVDHIVPLKSPTVCGLHCHQNLQVIPLVMNRAKSNRHWPDQGS